MINKVKILTTNASCRRTQKVINRLKAFFEKHNIEAEFTIISNLEEILKYRTWILPTIIINDIITGKGCLPPKEKILSNIIKTNNILQT